MYLLYHIKMQGWKTKTGNYSSDYKLAAEFDEAEALAQVDKFKDHSGAVTLLPVLRHHIARDE